MLRPRLLQLALLLTALGNFIFLACGEKSSKPDEHAGVVVAKVNNTVITANDFEKQMEQVASFRVTRLFNEDQKKALLVDMINFELIFQKLNQEGFLQTNDAVRRLAVQEYLLHKITERYTPSEAEILAYYKKERANLDRICVRHILVADEKKAMQLIERLKNFEDFATLASRESIDGGSAALGGDLGCIQEKVGFVAEFVKAAFALKKAGDITNPPIKTNFGYHIILLAQDLRGLEKNCDTIRVQLANNKRQEMLDELLIGLKEKGQIEAHFDKLTPLNLAPEPSSTVGKP